MLVYNSTRFFKAKGIQKPFTYMVTHGFSDNFATAFVHNRFRKLNLDDVQRLCELLLCTPNDLIQWIPETKHADNPAHPLRSLKRNTKVMGSYPHPSFRSLRKALGNRKAHPTRGQ